MKFYVFGSCSGTEPFPNRHHTALAFDIGGRIYWFDAGEGCAHTAHLMGLDLMAVSDIFISHPHMDHVGGLPHLLWTIRKLYTRTKRLPLSGDISVYSPNEASFLGTIAMLKNSEGNYEAPYETHFRKVRDGVLLQNEAVTVTAKHNSHLPQTDEGYQSFSFVLEGEGKRLVYSGDYRTFEELAALPLDGCDLLACETGHHDPVKVCEKLRHRGIGKLCFLHHGRPIMENYDDLLAKCRAVMPNTVFCNDGDVFEI